MIIIRKHAQVPMVCEKLYIRVAQKKLKGGCKDVILE